MVNFTIEFTNLSHNEGVITKVHWMLTGVLNGNTRSISGTVDLDSTGSTDFIPYQSVTKSKVREWVQIRMHSTLMKAEARITRELTPVVVTETMGTPW